MSSPEREPAISLWNHLQLPPNEIQYLHLSSDADADLAINSSFKLGSAAQTSIGLAAVSADHFYSLRSGDAQSQNIFVDVRHAVLEFASEAWYTIDGKFPIGDAWDALAGIYKTKDGGFVRIHTNFPHHRQGILDILQCAATQESIQTTLMNWTADDFETTAASRKMCATALRSFEEWDAHPQGQALAGRLPVELVKIGEAPKRGGSGHPGPLPLDGIRVLDLSRVLAGPVCGRTLAAYGADVLLVTSPNLPDLPLVDTDTSRGKRSTQIDLTTVSGRDTLLELCTGTDVFLQAYRPGGLSEKGFGPDQLAKTKPGIVYASLNAYGWDGPWQDRRGFDSLVQTATGFNLAESEAFAEYEGRDLAGSKADPKPFPMQALDHAAGYLLAFGINAALCKTMTEGGSWEVRVSLAAVGQWIRSLGRLSGDIAFGKGQRMPPRAIPQDPEISKLSMNLPLSGLDLNLDDKGEEVGRRGVMRAIRHAAIFETTPIREMGPPMGLAMHPPEWL